MMYNLNYQAYQRICAPQQVLDWVAEGVKIAVFSLPPPCQHQNRINSTSQKRFVTEVQKLLTAGVIRETKIPPRCILALTCAPKKKRKWRLVLDCRPINIHIKTPSFTEENIHCRKKNALKRVVQKRIKHTVFVMFHITFQCNTNTIKQIGYV